MTLLGSRVTLLLKALMFTAHKPRDQHCKVERGTYSCSNDFSDSL